MDNQRLLVWAAFAFLAWITYQTWVQDYGPKPQPPAAEQAADTLSAPPATVATDEDLPAITDTSDPETLPSSPEAPSETAAAPSAPALLPSTPSAIA